jgi:hypothetical protein
LSAEAIKICYVNLTIGAVLPFKPDLGLRDRFSKESRHEIIHECMRLTPEGSSGISFRDDYIFVHAVRDFPKPVDSQSHPARHILQQIISQPALMGDSAVSDPQPFIWDGNDAAYYLVNDTNENVSLVMAVVIANESQLVAINISCPSDRAASIREALPDLLADLWVNGALMSTSAMDALPDPLVFPTYTEATTTP